jgi:uncharacterized protein YecE (DUF72 family)
MPPVRIGTVDLPERIDRARYFRELSYLELSALFVGPLKPSARTRWAEDAPKHAVGLVAPWVMTQRTPPAGERRWPHDVSVGDFRDSAPARVALAALREAVDELACAHAVFRSPRLFAPSVANRDVLRRFFAELATPEAVGASRVWLPDGLWEPRVAVRFAGELGVTCAIDPLVHDPAQPETYEDLEASSLYFRIGGLGRAGALRSEKLEDLASLIETYQGQGVELTVAFASPKRWVDARNLRKLLGESGPASPDGEGDDDSGEGGEGDEGDDDSDEGDD